MLFLQAEKRFHHRQEQEVQKKLRGDDDWMLPAVARKLEQQSNNTSDMANTGEKSSHKKSKKVKKEKKSKKSKKEKKSKRKKKDSSSDSDSDSDSDEEERERRRRSKRKSSSSESDEWVESGAKKMVKAEAVPVQRDDWMSGMLIPTFSKKETAPKKDERVGLDKYDPKQSSRELNPFWKNGGTGLPSFQKPSNDSDDDEDSSQKRRHQSRTEAAAEFRGNWRKKNDSKVKAIERKRSRSPEKSTPRSRPISPEWGRKADARRSESPATRKEMCSSASSSRTPSPAHQQQQSADSIQKPQMQDFMTDQQMNDLGAKIIKAEIIGNDDLAKSLKDKLEAARSYRANHKHELLQSTSNARQRKTEKEEVLLTATNSQGFSKPLQRTATASSSAAASDPWGGRGKKGRAKKVETHSADGERLRFFADDDKYDIKQMVSVFVIFIFYLYFSFFLSVFILVSLSVVFFFY